EEVLGRAYKQQTPARFVDAINSFERVVNDPNGTRTETSAKAQFLIGETLFLQNKWEQAFLAYQKVIHNYEFPIWQSASLFQSGKCSENLKQWDEAEKSYKSLIETFSQSNYVPEAKLRLEFVQKNLKKS
ncbi:MAG: tetratricopeptide repeat protein, partial [Planctomycetes bacterium]|nr:tetratricopeptide repeat protein [Planctomycetota bacterium]